MNEIDNAFKAMRRVNFLPEDVVSQAGFDSPLPIGFGQTNSQPSTVRTMLEWLEVKPGSKVLDVGSGSGWTSALLSRLVGPSGKVFAVEAIPELVEFGRDNCRRLGVANVRFYAAGHAYGLPRFAPYDRILVSAAANELPSELVEQLKIGGKMVIPVGNEIQEINRTGPDKTETDRHYGFAFVPLVKT